MTTPSPVHANAAPLLSVRDLRVAFNTPDGVLEAVRGISFSVDRGQVLGVIAEVADEVVVMYARRAMEVAPRRDLFRTPSHPYTRGLLESIPRADGNGAQLMPIRGQPLSAIAPPPGCPFHPRCAHVVDRCRADVPPLDALTGAALHMSAC